MDLNKLTTGHWVSAGGAVLLFLSSFFPWFGIDFGGVSGFGDITANGWDYALVWLGMLLVIAGVVFLALKVFGTTEIKVGAFKTEQVSLLVIGLGAVFVLIQVLVGDSPADRRIGLWLGLIGAVAAAVGAFLTMRDAGVAMPGADEFKSLGGSDSGGGAPPPPPPPAE
jgi:hypothetical protein